MVPYSLLPNVEAVTLKIMNNYIKSMGKRSIFNLNVIVLI